VRQRSRRRRMKNLGNCNSNMVVRGRMWNGSLWWKGRSRCCCCLTQFGGSDFVRRISFGRRIWTRTPFFLVLSLCLIYFFKKLKIKLV
jgi:hypothetical protein